MADALMPKMEKYLAAARREAGTHALWSTNRLRSEIYQHMPTRTMQEVDAEFFMERVRIMSLDERYVGDLWTFLMAPSSAVPPSRFFGYFQAICERHSVMPHQNRSLRLGMAGRESGDTIIRFGWHVQRLRQRESRSHGQVPGLCITAMMQFHEFRRGLAPGALRRDHCQHRMVRKAADRPRRPRLIWTPGFVRIAGNLATQIDS